MITVDSLTLMRVNGNRAQVLIAGIAITPEGTMNTNRWKSWFYSCRDL